MMELKVNQKSLLLQVGTPTCNVNFNTNSQSDIRYTTNGDVPDLNDPILNSNLSFNSSTVFSAKAFSNQNLLPSEAIDRTFIINEQNHNLPVFSIITDEDNLWIGILEYT